MGIAAALTATILRLMDGFIGFVLGNFTLSFFVLGLVASAISLAVKKPAAGVADRFLAGFLFFAIGLCYFYNFVMHVFFAEMAASFIGWANSPFQYEVGYASLGFAVVALLATFGGFQLRLGAIVGPALFMWGAAGGHIYQIIEAHNDAPGNAGIMLWSDILLPVIGFGLLFFAYRGRKKS